MGVVSLVGGASGGRVVLWAWPGLLQLLATVHLPTRPLSVTPGQLAGGQREVCVLPVG